MGGDAWTDFSSLWLGPGHSASPPGRQPRPSPQTLPREPGTADPLPAPGPGPPGLGSPTSPYRRTPASPPGPQQQSPTVLRRPPATPGFPSPTASSSGRGRCCRAPSHQHQLRTGTPAGGKGTGAARGARTAHPAPSAGHLVWLGRGCLRGPPSSGCCTGPPPRALSLSCWPGSHGRWLSCSGPWCPPPAPTCSGAAAAVPARPSPGPSGSVEVGGGHQACPGLGVAHIGCVQSGLQAEATLSHPLSAEGPGPGAGTPRPRDPGVPIRPSSPKTTRTGLRSLPALQAPEPQGLPPAPAGPAGLCAHTRLPRRPVSPQHVAELPSPSTAPSPRVSAPLIAQPLGKNRSPPPPCSDLPPGLLRSPPHPLKPTQKLELAPEPSSS